MEAGKPQQPTTRDCAAAATVPLCPAGSVTTYLLRSPLQDQPKAPVEIYVSFGGLLMRLRGDARHLTQVRQAPLLYHHYATALLPLTASSSF